MAAGGFPTPFWLTCAGLAVVLMLYIAGAVRRRRLAGARLLGRLAASERAAKAAHEALLQDVQGLVLQLQVVADFLHEGTGLGEQQLAVALDAADRLLARGCAPGMGRALSLDFRGELEQMFAELALALSEGDSAGFSLAVSGDGDEPEPAQREAIYRIGREALFNAYRHAGASHVEMELNYARKRLSLHVRDDGIGFDRAAAGLAAHPAHRGLMLMHERATMLRANLRIWSGPGMGTEVMLAVPLDPSPAGASVGPGWRARLPWLARCLGLPV
jgi:signal transduction histidine kinase